MLNSLVVKKAFGIIRRNYGCPGPDHLSIQDIKYDMVSHTKSIIEIYEKNNFGVLPVSKTKLLDYTNNFRDIYVYCLYDRWIQQILKMQIESIIDSRLKDCVFSNRRNMNMKMLCDFIGGYNRRYILKLDIAKFFDNVDRRYLYDRLLANTSIKQDMLNKIDLCLSHISNGLPPGNVLSPLLSNYYLTEIDNMFESEYARFSDDMFFAINSENEKDAIIHKVSDKLAAINLSINFEKTVLSDAKNFK